MQRETNQMNLLKTEQVAEMLGVSKSKVQEYVHAGLPYVDLGTNPKRKTLRFRPADVEKWIADQVRSEKPKTRRREPPKRAINRYNNL